MKLKKVVKLFGDSDPNRCTYIGFCHVFPQRPFIAGFWTSRKLYTFVQA